MKTLLPRFLLLRLGKFYHPYLFLTLLLIFADAVSAQTVTTGRSYINITRPNGGTFLPGDIIEVRSTIAVNGGSSTNRVNSIRYNDTINLAKFTYVTNSLQMISNEGRLQHQYTDGADTDSAHIDYGSGRLRFNIGNNAGSANVTTQGTSITNGGRLWGALRPTFYNSTCIRMYVYRVQIRNTPAIVALDSTILLSSGNFRYSIGSNSFVSSFPVYTIHISSDFGLCSNSVGTNAILGESGGTFGSGAAQNRAGGSTFVPAPYTFQTFSSGTPNDNYYGLANRTSADGTTNANVPYSSGTGSASRVFTVWDIIGDHTGAVNPLAGNPPTSTGYAVVINASYETNRAFTQNITSVCEETYYEFSAWFRNICRRCGCDSSGIGASQSGYRSGPEKDSSGVRPNLTFQIDGQDYYTTGNLAYSGEWVKKGFIFKTKKGQMGFNVTIRNNAPGGGGNDWAIDDIKVATCLPDMKYSPSLTPNICIGSPLKLTDTVRSYFGNYVYYKWQRSALGVGPWTDITAPVGPVSTTYNGSYYEYWASYTVPAGFTTTGNTGDKYRVIVATSTDNIASASCSFTDVANIITLNVISCGVLDTKLTGFSGVAKSGQAVLKWSTTGEKGALFFDVERSEDGIHFAPVATINNTNDYQSDVHQYTYSDPTISSGKVYYRIGMRSASGASTYSRILLLGSGPESFSFGNVVNPFKTDLLFDISSPRPGRAIAELVDQLGHTLGRRSFDIRQGVNQLSFDNTSTLASGVYILKMEFAGQSIYKRVMKE